MKKYLFIFCLLLTSFVEQQPYYPVSIIELIASPKQYEDVRVGVDGFLVYRFEHQSIYFSSESAKKSLYKNGVRVVVDSNTIWISKSGKKVNTAKIRDGQSASVNGVFKPDKNRPSFSAYSGIIVAHKICLD